MVHLLKTNTCLSRVFLFYFIFLQEGVVYQGVSRVIRVMCQGFWSLGS